MTPEGAWLHRDKDGAYMLTGDPTAPRPLGRLTAKGNEDMEPNGKPAELAQTIHQGQLNYDKLNRVKVHRLPGYGRKLLIVQAEDRDEYEYRPRVNLIASNFVALVQAVVAYQEDAACDVTTPVFTVSGHAIDCALDGIKGEDLAIFQTPKTHEAQRLGCLIDAQLSNEKPLRFTQQELIELLRVTLRQPPETVAPFRKLHWSASRMSNAEIQRDRMGQNVNEEAAGAVEVPGELLITVPIYLPPATSKKATISLLVEPDVTRQDFLVSFNVSEWAAEMHAAQQENQRLLVEAWEIIQGEDVPAPTVFLGGVIQQEENALEEHFTSNNADAPH